MHVPGRFALSIARTAAAGLAGGAVVFAAAGVFSTAGCESSGDSGDGGADAIVVQPCATAPAPLVEVVGSLSVGRQAPSVAAIGPGKYLVAGGNDFTKGLASSAEIVEPMVSKFTATGGLESARNFAAVALLDPTHVLVSGGASGSGTLSASEIYDVGAGKFARTGNLGEPRQAHVALPLKDGRVVVLGGLAGTAYSATGEFFDPKAGTFAAITSKMSTPRALFAAGLSDDGALAFAAGGGTADGKETATVELLDVAKSSFSVNPTSLARPARGLAAARLADGRWLVAGGTNATDASLVDAQLFDPKSGAVTKVAPLGTRRAYHSLTTLGDGRILAVGGYSDGTTPAKSTNVMEVYDPKTDTWEQLPVGLSSPRHDHAAVLLPDCRVAIVGGQYAEAGKAPFSTYDVELVTVPFKR